MVNIVSAWELANGQDPECLGIFFGFIGRIKCPVIEEYILLVKESVLVGELPSGHAVHKIKSVCLFNPITDVSKIWHSYASIFLSLANYKLIFVLILVLPRFRFKTMFQTSQISL